MSVALPDVLPELLGAPVSNGRKVILLGPQRIRTTLGAVLAAEKIGGQVASVTAGWQEREDEVEELQEQLHGHGVNLRLHARGEIVFREDPELAELHRERQQVLQSTQRLYDVRLRHAMAAIAELAHRKSPEELLQRELGEAMDALRQLDTRHLIRIREIHREWEPKLRLGERPIVRRHREEVAAILRDCSALAISGGHVVVLLNRLRLFAVLEAFPPDRPVVGWSGGAIVLTEKIVFYHDSPPQGPGNAELFEGGFGLARNIVALPHAKRRLRLDDGERVARFARRFAPATCAVLDDGGALVLRPDGYTADAGVRRLDTRGTVEAM
jgi:hypothetical protein